MRVLASCMLRTAMAVLALGAGRVIATPAPELQKSARTATFEVVVPKPKEGLLTYEKALPLEMLPFAVRNDAYWSIGTAFAVSPGVYVTAAHVIGAGIGSLPAVPALRDDEGRVYPIDRVLKYSAPEDFAVFTVTGSPSETDLKPQRQVSVDDRVYAVGNALGEGVVIRDGLLTSMTPEDQDGRWKWLRFSAAASPGNSGGPLLNERSEVLGVVTAKSPGENLNYALPIARVLDAPEGIASFDSRQTVSLPMVRGSTITSFQRQFRIPPGYPDFVHELLGIIDAAYEQSITAVLQKQAAEIFPNGKSADLLSDSPSSPVPSFVVQDDDGKWVLSKASYSSKVDLPDRGGIWTQTVLDVGVFRLRRSSDAADDVFYTDTRAVMDQLLKGIKLPRVVGSEAVRIVSMGNAQSDTEFVDGFGRKWRLRSWSVDFASSQMVALMLPVPDGFVGMLKFAPNETVGPVIREMKLLADYVYVTYAGTIPQWRAFLARKSQLPETFTHLRLACDYASGVNLRSSRFEVNAPPSLIKLDESSVLDVLMGYVFADGQLRWDVKGLILSADPEANTYIGVIRQSEPADDASSELTQRWQAMQQLTGDYAQERGHDADWKKFWRRGAVDFRGLVEAGASKAKVLYDVYSDTDAGATPRRIDDMYQQLLENVRVLEH